MTEKILAAFVLKEPLKISITRKEAFALSHKMRWNILLLLEKSEMTAQNLATTMKIKAKNFTGLRHHLAILQEAGMIQMSKIVERRGAIEKYYRSIAVLPKEIK